MTEIWQTNEEQTEVLTVRFDRLGSQDHIALKVHFHREGEEWREMGVFRLSELHGSVMAFQQILAMMAVNPNYQGDFFSISLQWEPRYTDDGIEPIGKIAGHYDPKEGEGNLVDTLTGWIGRKREELIFQAEDSSKNEYRNAQAEIIEQLVRLINEVT